MRVAGVGAFIYGLGMTFGPDAGFRSSAYDTAFLLWPRQLWGLGFLVSGILITVRLHLRTVQVLASVIFAWAFALLWELMHQIIERGEADSITAPIWALTVAVSLLAVVERFGLDE